MTALSLIMFCRMDRPRKIGAIWKEISGYAMIWYIARIANDEGKELTYSVRDANGTTEWDSTIYPEGAVPEL